MKQRTLAMMTGFEQYTRKTRRAIFLEEMEQVVPWGELCALVAPHYPQPGKGRRPVGVERMLRGGGDGGQRSRFGGAARSIARRGNAGVGRSGLSRTERSDPGVRASGPGLHPSALPLQGWC